MIATGGVLTRAAARRALEGSEQQGAGLEYVQGTESLKIVQDTVPLQSGSKRMDQQERLHREKVLQDMQAGNKGILGNNGPWCGIFAGGAKLLPCACPALKVPLSFGKRLWQCSDSSHLQLNQQSESVKQPCCKLPVQVSLLKADADSELMNWDLQWQYPGARSGSVVMYAPDRYRLEIDIKPAVEFKQTVKHCRAGLIALGLDSIPNRSDGDLELSTTCKEVGSSSSGTSATHSSNDAGQSGGATQQITHMSDTDMIPHVLLVLTNNDLSQKSKWLQMALNHLRKTYAVAARSESPGILKACSMMGLVVQDSFLLGDSEYHHKNHCPGILPLQWQGEKLGHIVTSLQQGLVIEDMCNPAAAEAAAAEVPAATDANPDQLPFEHRHGFTYLGAKLDAMQKFGIHALQPLLLSEAWDVQSFEPLKLDLDILTKSDFVSTVWLDTLLGRHDHDPSFRLATTSGTADCTQGTDCALPVAVTVSTLESSVSTGPNSSTREVVTWKPLLGPIYGNRLVPLGDNTHTFRLDGPVISAMSAHPECVGKKVVGWRNIVEPHARGCRVGTAMLLVADSTAIAYAALAFETPSVTEKDGNEFTSGLSEFDSLLP